MQYFTTANARKFDIFIEGALVVGTLDIYALAPGSNVPYVVTVSTVVTDGAITIDFVRNVENPQINGIEVLYGDTPTSAPIMAPTLVPIVPPTKAPVLVPILPPTKAPVLVPTTADNIVHRVNCGSTNQVVVPPNNIAWTPDQYAASGSLYNTCGSVSTSIYCTSRYFGTTDAAPYRYNLPVTVSNRSYTVRLHFAEQVRYLRIECSISSVSNFHLLHTHSSVYFIFSQQYFQKNNARIFDVYIEGTLLIDNLDIYASAPGGNVPYVVTFSIFVADDAITIDLVRNKQNPQINGIEVFSDAVPISSPVAPVAPVAAPPNLAPSPSNQTFQDIVINCGGMFLKVTSCLLEANPSISHSCHIHVYRSTILRTIWCTRVECR
jgi:Malectin domain